MTARPDAMLRLEGATSLVREQVEQASELLTAFGVPRFALGGSMLRPLTAYALAGTAAVPPAAPRFWCAALAVQLAHEASLLHDDVIDGSAQRRGTATVAAARGTAAALLIGDHALTSAYRAAAMSADVSFMSMFARAVERTVAGERAQAAAIGSSMDLGRYREIVLGKSGELFGCAAAIGPVLLGDRNASRCFDLGRRVGLVYQMLDDLLDYCPATDTGKPAFGDATQGRWTWPLSALESIDSLGTGADGAGIGERLFARSDTHQSPARRALRMLEREMDGVRDDLRAASPDTLLIELIEQWRSTARAAIDLEETRRRRPSPRPPVLLPAMPTTARAAAFMSRHSRSFRFASLMLPADQRVPVERLYAWCRYTDDIVDRVDSRDPAAISGAQAALDAWLELSRSAYMGMPSGIGLLDAVMQDMARHSLPFAHAALLIDGVRMDLRAVELATMDDLRRYTYRVASVVGLWLCGLYSIDDPWMLERASALGHAMQLTNILRDVGEDLDRQRLYVPVDVMARHGLARDDLVAMRAGARPIDAAYRGMIDQMIDIADASYRFANEAIPHLPAGFGRSVAVASAVYSDIHRRIRANGYDNLRLRAYTTSVSKVAVGARALLRLRAPRVVLRQQAGPSPIFPYAPDRHALG
jgi:phytoene synthase